MYVRKNLGLKGVINFSGHHLGWLIPWIASVTIGVMIAWVFLVMELVGDYSENPFEGLSNDIPMISICRNIEIDLMELIGEKDIPNPIEVKKGVLM